MATYKIIIAGDLGKSAFFLINSHGKTIELTAKRKIGFNFLSLTRHISLEYHFANLRFSSLFMLTLKRIISNLILFPKRTVGFMLFQYDLFLYLPKTINIPIEIIHLNDGNPTSLWVSRQSQIGGIFSYVTSKNLESDMFRGESHQAYCLEIRGLDSEEFSSRYPMQNSNVLRSVSIKELIKPNSGTIRTLQLKDVLIDRTQVHVKAKIAYPVHKFDFIEETSVPTPLISLHAGHLSYYPITNLEIQNCSVLTSIPYSENWYHFIFEGLGAYLNQETQVLSGPILISENCHRNIKQIISYVTGFEPIAIQNRTSIRVECLSIVQEWRFENRFDFYSRSDDIKQIRDRLTSTFLMNSHKNEYGSLTGSNSSEIVFLSRGKNLYRRMANIDQVHHYLQQIGVLVINPADLEFLELYSVIQNAKILILETGAAMANLIFCRKDAVIIEINPEGFEPHFWSGLAKVLTLNYQKITAKEKVGSFGQKYIFPIEELMYALKEYNS